MDLFGSNNYLDLTKSAQYFNEDDFKKSWPPANVTTRNVWEIDSLQPLDVISSGRSHNWTIWGSSGDKYPTAGRPGLSESQFTPILEVARNNYSDFAKNGIESELDEFDMYQTRLRSLAVDDKVVLRKSGAEMKTKNLSCKMSKNTVCVFCKNNKETLSVYGTHVLKDYMGRVTCPILRRYTCPICGCSGDKAHTIKYCPFNLTSEGNDALLKTPRNSFGKKRSFP